MMGQKIKKRKKGFTVGELLIVVGIISVLVSVAIPVLNKQLERAREAYDIYTMRQAASAAIELYYSGVHDAASAGAAGLSWSDVGDSKVSNAYGAYNPATGTFYKTRWDLPPAMRTYGKGTTRDGGTTYVLGNETGAYSSKSDYTQACVMVSIYPNATPNKYAVIYWKRKTQQSSGPYIGGKEVENVPKYSIKIILD